MVATVALFACIPLLRDNRSVPTALVCTPQEYIPTRTEQLLREPYGPTGSAALLPEGQMDSSGGSGGTAAVLTLANVERSTGPTSAANLRNEWQYVEVHNGGDAAVDASGWTLRGSSETAALFQFAPGGRVVYGYVNVCVCVWGGGG